LWAVLTGALIRAAQLIGEHEQARFAVLVFVAVLVALPAIELGADVRSEDPSVEVLGAQVLPRPAERPNVYWIVLDSYAGPDILQEVAGIDVDPFVEELEDQGFTVSTSSRTSYNRTILSLASTLEMQYVLEPGHDITDEFELFAPVVVGRSSTTAHFEALGYETVYGPAGGVEWSACRPDLVDACLPLRRPSPHTGELEQALLDLTPLGTISLPVPYADPQTLIEGLADPDLGIEAPFFAYQHILTPHAPYRYRDDCSPRAVPQEQSSPTQQRAGYATQVRCISQLVLRAIPEIVERDPTAIILIQSDHGPEASFRWFDSPTNWPVDQAHARFAAFNAMRLPSRCQHYVEGAALINTFRIVFACIEGRDPDLLDYRAFAYPLKDSAGLVELTPAQLSE
jgi:hypothetical protein